MLPGITGSLIAGAFLESVVLDELRTSPELPRLVQALHQWWKRAERALGPASGPRALLDLGALPLMQLLGYEVLRAEPHADGFVGTIGEGPKVDAVFRTTAWGSDASAAWRDTVRAGRLARTRWGFVYTGRVLRVVDGARTWSRRALEFDLARVVGDERSATVVCALLRHATVADRAGVSVLENIVRQSDTHGASVCADLGAGVIDALTALLGALDDTAATRRLRQDRRETFQQSVTIVYRLLFLLFAEARQLVPTWHRVYRDAYTIDALCRRTSERRRAHGLWAAVQAISRLAHAGCRAGDLTVTAFNGRLFSPTDTPLAEHARVPDDVIGRAILSLAMRAGAEGRRRIAYADLGVEQLGAVYEKVLEYEPGDARRPAVLTRTSIERKTTGSFYTPRSMTEFLVRRALHPLVEGQSADDILGLRVLDPAMGSGAFLVAACRFLAAAAERAMVRDGGRPYDDGDARRAELKRLVAQRCLYGVDLNPMAVQLARLSLWLTTLAGDKPLTFLDHHVAAGDSLVGIGLWDLARRPSPGRGSDRILPLLADQTTDPLATQILPERFRLALEPGDTVAAVRDKERLLAALNAPGTPLERWKTAANVWCANWFRADGRLPSNLSADLIAAVLERQPSLSRAQHSKLIDEASTLTRAHRFFHWELEFPEVFFDRHGRHDPNGGFDAVIGNPPWDALRADTGDEAHRHRARAAHQARLRFFRDAGLYRQQGSGHANCYQLFAERCMQLARPNGRLGLLLPAGFATDRGSARLRRALLESMRVDRVIGFDNRSAVFPIHRDVRFLLLTGTLGGRTDSLSCAFGQSQADWLDELPDACADDPPDARPVTLSRRLLDTLDPENLGFPMLQRPADVDLLAFISATVPRSSSEKGWGISFGRELNATEDRHHFIPAGSRAGPLLTVVEGKHIEPFRVRLTSCRLAIPAATATDTLDPDRTFRRMRLAYRDVASATNRLTVIAALLPAGTISTHTLFCLRTFLSADDQYCLLALLNSLVTNYLVRLQVTTHVTAALMARLPVPRPKRDSTMFRRLSALARSLESTGMESGHGAYVELNSAVAELYALNVAQYERIVETFPLLDEELRRQCVIDFNGRIARHG
jgi:hypothetical protein